ncbi:endonuclease/exonuclease/phosphatase family protein [candidate division KSB1 bacterium]|nr:endonuclease/exonuclease/phosphatase family protein [candidate division KSB1 bacterium]
MKIMTYNIHYGIGRDNRYDLDRIIRVIEEADPDVVALQEVDNQIPRSAYHDQARVIGDALEMQVVPCVNRQLAGGEFGIATLSKYPLAAAERFDLSYHPRLEPRGTLRTDILVGDCCLSIFNVHLGLNPWERRFQRRRLLSEYILWHSSADKPQVVLGDFNDHVISMVHSGFRRYYRDTVSTPLPTFYWGKLGLRLDYIYIDEGLRTIDTAVIDSPLALLASDHLPLMTQLAFVKETPPSCGRSLPIIS